MKIEKNVPIPPARRGAQKSELRLLMEKMEVGDSIAQRVAAKEAQKVRLKMAALASIVWGKGASTTRIEKSDTPAYTLTSVRIWRTG